MTRRIWDRLRGGPGIEIEAAQRSVQTLAPPSDFQRFEGIAFSSSGNILGVATADTDAVFLFRRKPDGSFEDRPYSTISGPASQLSYPHDLAFCTFGADEFLAVAQRTGSICIYRGGGTDREYGPAPVFAIRGPEAKLNHSDGVAFVPPRNEYVAACNFLNNRITFYRKNPGADVGFTLKPAFSLKDSSIDGPDGLAFTRCGRWLAVANHGNHTVSIYRRRSIISRRKSKYAPVPVTVIKDPELRHPHSVAFTPETNHLVVTSSGANYFSVYRPERRGFRMQWSQSPVSRNAVAPDNVFRQLNAHNKMEGGPKGVAVHKNNLAVCCPEQGIRIYTFRESG
jgi:6-phosphogluconolactonase (cycloisomerase 2 family)